MKKTRPLPGTGRNAARGPQGPLPTLSLGRSAKGAGRSPGLSGSPYSPDLPGSLASGLQDFVAANSCGAAPGFTATSKNRYFSRSLCQDKNKNADIFTYMLRFLFPPFLDLRKNS